MTIEVERPSNGREVEISGRPIGLDYPPFIIAELSGNHRHDISLARELLDAAAAAGVDAVKLQTYTPDTLTIDHAGPGFVVEKGLWAGRTLYDLYREAHTPWAWHEELFTYGRELGLIVFSTPFDETAVDLLASLDAPAYKIASFEAVDLELIRAVARRDKPLIISTGMTSLAEIHEAVATARASGAGGVALLHCVSSYPARFEQANLRTIPHLAEAFDVVVGLSDHTPGTACAVAAVAQGASIIEKHFTLRRADGGPDAAFSLEPDELARLVADCRNAWLALGRVDYARSPAERESTVFRRSLFVVRDLAVGEVVSATHVRSIRPGYGLAPKHLPEVLGRRTAREVKRGEPVTWDILG